MVKLYSRSRSRSTLHSCHSQFVLFVKKDVHGLVVIRQRVPFEVKKKKLFFAGVEFNYDSYLCH